MKRIFLLSKGNPNLAKEEVLALAGKRDFKMAGSLMVMDASFDFSRLAYTRAVYDFLFSAPEKGLEKAMASYKWSRIYKSPFCIRVFGADKKLESRLASFVWDNVKNPEVDLKNADTSIHLFFHRGRVFAGLLRHAADAGQFEKRKPHLRAEMHPTSLHPRLARCMVNLTGIRKGTITDPFCGTGGILIEAGLMGLNAEGLDIEKEMLEMAEKNLKKYMIKCRLRLKDATEISKKLGYVVSDLPYGKATKSQDLRKLYSGFFAVLKKRLQKKAVLGLPDFIDSRKLLKKAGLIIEKEFTYYIHKSLSKRIFVVSA